MPCAADPIGQHAGERQVRLEAAQPVRHGAEGLRHGRAINDRQHRHAEAPRQIGRRGRAIEQAHHPFDQDQVGLARRFPEQAPRLLFADHPQVELIDRLAAGTREDHRVEKVRPALEHPHALALPRMQPRQSRGDGGLALAGCRGGNQQRRAVSTGHRGLSCCSSRLISFRPCARKEAPRSSTSSAAIGADASPGAWRTRALEFNAFLRLYSGLERVLDQAHFGDGVRRLDQSGGRAAAGDHHVLQQRP